MPFYAPRLQAILTPLFLTVIVAVPHSAVSHGVAPHSAVPHGAVSHSALPSGTVGTVPTVVPSTLLTSSVKLRVDDANGHSWGTGTIIDTRQSPHSPTGREALILTCGHIFRESRGEGRIEVHLFGENSTVRVYGRCLFYDLEIDLALVAIAPPGPVRAIPIAPEGYLIQPFQQVWSVGCDHGGNPTIQAHQIMSVDRISTPRENRVPFHYIQVSGAPVSGRSGGGLFSANGYLIGVCNTACPTVNDGHFVPPHKIRYILDRTNLAFVHRNPSLGEPPRQTMPQMELAALTPLTPLVPLESLPPAPPMAMTAVPAPMFADNPAAMGQTAVGQTAIEQNGTAQNRIEQSHRWQANVEQTNIGQNNIGQSSAGHNSMNMGREEQATLEEITRRKQDGAEVIVIIRSPRNPEIPSDVIVMNGASDRFLDALVNNPVQSANPAYNPVIFSSHDLPARTTDRQPVSFPVRH